MLTTRRCLAGLIVISTGALCACYPDLQEQEIQASAPVEKINLRGSRIIVCPDDDHEWSELVKLDLFAGFEPGMTFDAARERVGPPDATGTNLYGPYYEYRRPGGRVVVAWEEHRSGGDAYTDWRLHAYPDEQDPAALFHAEIVHHLEGRLEGRKELTIMHTEKYGPALWTVLKDGRVTSVTWYQ